MPSILILDEQNDGAMTELPVSTTSSSVRCIPRHSRVNSGSDCDVSSHRAASVIPLSHEEDDDDSDSHINQSTIMDGQNLVTSINTYHFQVPPINALPASASVLQTALKIMNSSAAHEGDILAVMRSLPGEVEVQRLACQKLWVLSWDDDTAEQLGQWGAISMVLHAMARFPYDLPLLHAAAETLQNLAATSEWNCRELCRLGGLHLIVQAMRHNMDHSGLQLCGCATMESVALLAQDDLKAFILQARGLEIMLCVLHCHGTNQTVLVGARQALEAMGYNLSD